MNRVLEVFIMKARQSLSFGLWEPLLFMIVASPSAMIIGGRLYYPSIPPELSQGIGPLFQSFLAVDYTYYQFIVTILAMSVFVLKVLVFDFAANLEQEVETSYLLLPVKRSTLLLPILVTGVILPYSVASASVFYALYLVHFPFNAYDALSVALLDFLPLLLVSSVTMLVSMKTKSSVSALGTAILLLFFLGIFLGLNGEITARTHSVIPFMVLGVLFPAASAYDYFFFGYAPSLGGMMSTPAGFMSVFPWLIAGSVVLNVSLLAAVFWYWGRRFQISG